MHDLEIVLLMIDTFASPEEVCDKMIALTDLFAGLRYCLQFLCRFNQFSLLDNREEFFEEGVFAGVLDFLQGEQE